MLNAVNPKYFFYGLLSIVLIFTFFIFRPFLPVLVLSAALAVVLSPLYETFRTRVTGGRNWLASLMTLVFFIVILVGPLILIGSMVYQQSNELYTTLSSGTSTSGFVETLSAKLENSLPFGSDIDLSGKIAVFVSQISDNIAGIFKATLTTFFSFLLLLLALFYFLKDGKDWKEGVVFWSPLADHDDKKVLDRLTDAINGVMKGYLLIALVQGVVMGIGLSIFGVPHAALFGVLTGIASLVPTIGTALVSIPAILFLYFTGHDAAALGMLLWATVLVGTIDNVLNPIVVGRKINIHPLLILFSVLGGMALLGPLGLLVGPLSVALLHALLLIYQERTA